MTDAQAIFDGGLPPRGRGKGKPAGNPLWPAGITPAHAGKRTRSWRAYGCPWNHPRVGGEKTHEQQLRAAYEGSPPRGRGKAFSVLRRQFRFRITPAWAGKRQTATMPRTMTRDHPRMGREKTMYFEDKYFCRGSPPHGRGKDATLKTSSAKPGITPAWAGKRPSARSPAEPD